MAAKGGEKDALYDQAVEIVLKDRKASISYVQRKLKIGYNRAARLLEDMEKAGLVSALTTSGQRDILVPSRPERPVEQALGSRQPPQTGAFATKSPPVPSGPAGQTQEPGRS